jgi:hypothetical protein
MSWGSGSPPPADGSCTRLYELEIFAGEGVAVDPASVTALTQPEVG